jgi:hypothetical protein
MLLFVYQTTNIIKLSLASEDFPEQFKSSSVYCLLKKTKIEIVIRMMSLIANLFLTLPYVEAH